MDVVLETINGATSLVASAKSVTLVYADEVIQLQLVRGCWSAIVVTPGSIRRADYVSENGDWL